MCTPCICVLPIPLRDKAWRTRVTLFGKTFFCFQWWIAQTILIHLPYTLRQHHTQLIKGREPCCISPGSCKTAKEADSFNFHVWSKGSKSLYPVKKPPTVELRPCKALFFSWRDEKHIQPWSSEKKQRLRLLFKSLCSELWKALAELGSCFSSFQPYSVTSSFLQLLKTFSYKNPKKLLFFCSFLSENNSSASGFIRFKNLKSVSKY